MRSDKYIKNYIGKKIKDEDIKSPADTLTALWKVAEAQLKSWSQESVYTQTNWMGNSSQNLNWTSHYTSQQQWGQNTNLVRTPDWSVVHSGGNTLANNSNYNIQALDYIVEKGLFNYPQRRLFVSSGNGAFFPCPLTA